MFKDDTVRNLYIDNLLEVRGANLNSELLENQLLDFMIRHQLYENSPYIHIRHLSDDQLTDEVTVAISLRQPLENVPQEFTFIPGLILDDSVHGFLYGPETSVDDAVREINDQLREQDQTSAEDIYFIYHNVFRELQVEYYAPVVN